MAFDIENPSSLQRDACRRNVQACALKHGATCVCVCAVEHVSRTARSWHNRHLTTQHHRVDVMWRWRAMREGACNRVEALCTCLEWTSCGNTQYTMHGKKLGCKCEKWVVRRVHRGRTGRASAMQACNFTSDCIQKMADAGTSSKRGPGARNGEGPWAFKHASIAKR
jgi:hypothetical protein